MRIKAIFIIFLALVGTVSSSGQSEQIGLLATQLRQEVKRIDLLDGQGDEQVLLKSNLQTNQATSVYLEQSSRISERIINSVLPYNQKIKQLNCVLHLLQKVDEKNVHFYTGIGSVFGLIRKVQDARDEQKIVAILESNVHSALQLIPFFAYKSAAEPFLITAAKTEPAELLRHYSEYNIKGLNERIIREVAVQAPMKLRTYLYSGNAIQRKVKRSADPVVSMLYRMVREQSANSKSFVLFNDVYTGKISASKAHDISKDDDQFLNYLINLRNTAFEYGEHSVDEALTNQALKRIRLVNELHDGSDAKRFASIQEMSPEQMYTLMVYSENEIFTSTFLGMYKRMKKKMDGSSFQFLHAVNYNKFRTFIKMCAGYNVLSDFLGMMSDFEKQMLFKRLVEGLEDAHDNLKSAVAIADTYGSMVKLENKMLLEESIIRYYKKVKYSKPAAAKLYGLLIQILGLGDGQNLGLPPLANNTVELPLNRIIKDGKNVQQHFFFDDPDGRSSYNTFVGTFRTANWKVVDKGTYIIIKSVRGKSVEIYVNKPAHEYAGQRAIHDHFAATKRWPDVVVHRGHSYFAVTAIESLTPNAEIVFLGSCGGYNNITQVLNYSPEAQIISSKQIGTMWVNNKLCYKLNETIRKGKDVVWETLWKEVEQSLGNTTAGKRFKDYIPPHKNMGALLIKAYRAGL